MKKLLVVLVLVMAVLAVNAQVPVTTTEKETPVRTTILAADLLEAITDNIAEDYADYTISEATKVVADEIVTYEVVVVKDTTTETLVYDNEGKFIKKLLPVLEEE